MILNATHIQVPHFDVEPTVPLNVHTGALGTVALVGLVSGTLLQLGRRCNHRPSVTPLCHFPACSIIGGQRYGRGVIGKG